MGVDLGSIGVAGKQRKNNVRNKIGDIIRSLIINSVLSHYKNFKCKGNSPKHVKMGVTHLDVYLNKSCWVCREVDSLFRERRMECIKIKREKS